MISIDKFTKIDAFTPIVKVDTIYNKVYLSDTIYNKIYLSDTIKPELIQIYDQLMSNQDNNFDNILILITIIVSVLIILVTLINIFVAKELFKKDAKEIYDTKNKEYEVKFDDKFKRVEKVIDDSVLQAISISFIHSNMKFSALKSLFQSLETILDLNESDEDIFFRIKYIIKLLKEINAEKLIPFETEFDIKSIYESVSKIPNKEYFNDLIKDMKAEINTIENKGYQNA